MLRKNTAVYTFLCVPQVLVTMVPRDSLCPKRAGSWKGEPMPLRRRRVSARTFRAGGLLSFFFGIGFLGLMLLFSMYFIRSIPIVRVDHGIAHDAPSLLQL